MNMIFYEFNFVKNHSQKGFNCIMLEDYTATKSQRLQTSKLLPVRLRSSAKVVFYVYFL